MRIPDVETRIHWASRCCNYYGKIAIVLSLYLSFLSLTFGGHRPDSLFLAIFMLGAAFLLSGMGIAKKMRLAAVAAVLTSLATVFLLNQLAHFVTGQSVTAMVVARNVILAAPPLLLAASSWPAMK